MKPRLLLFLAAGLFLAADDPKGDAAKADRDKIQGTWSIELAARRGEAVPKETADRIRVTITSDKISIHEGDPARAEEATFKLDPAQKPKEIDLMPARAGAGEKIAPGIYQLDGDTLKLCWSKPGGPRPAGFATGRENNQALFVLKRLKP